MLAAMERHGIRKTEPKSEKFDYDLLKPSLKWDRK